MRFVLVISVILYFTSVDPNPQDVYLIDDFEADLADHWKPRHKSFGDNYKLEKEHQNQFLSASSINSDNFIVKKVNVDIVKYPFLNWKWRVKTLPTAGDESVKDKCDVGASIALVLNANKIFPRSIKYSWSSTLEKGTRTKSPFAKWPAKCKIHVIESGKEHISHWKEEKVNLLNDYKLFYKKSNVKSKIVRAIVIMTDSDNTGSLSEADYDDIYFSKN